MPDLWTDLLGCLNLAATPSADTGEQAEAADVVTFEGTNQRLEYHRVFGGQILGQFVRAAAHVCPDKTIKSLHAFFPREGRADEPVRYEVTRQHQGRTFATLTIVARQTRGVVATGSVSMHTLEEGPERQTVAEVSDVPGPDHAVTIGLIPWEIRVSDDLDATTAGPPQYEMWMRTPAVDPELAPAALRMAVSPLPAELP